MSKIKIIIVPAFDLEVVAVLVDLDIAKELPAEMDEMEEVH